jgi:hypothetical protein
MTPLDTLVLVLLAVAILDKFLDLDHECWRADCRECQAERARQRSGRRPHLE